MKMFNQFSGNKSHKAISSFIFGFKRNFTKNIINPKVNFPLINLYSTPCKRFTTNTIRENAIPSQTISIISEKLLKQFSTAEKGNYQVEDVITLLSNIENFGTGIFQNNESRKIIEENFINLCNKLIDQNIIPESKINEVYLQIINCCFALRILNSEFWDKLQKFFEDNIQNISLENNIKILHKLMETFELYNGDRKRIEEFKSTIFEYLFVYEMYDFENLSLRNLFLFLGIFANNFTQNHNQIIYLIQKNLIDSHLKQIFSADKNDIEVICATIFKLMNNKEISINYFMEKLLDQVTKNIICVNSRCQLYLLSAYKLFLDRNQYTHLSIFYTKIRKFGKLIEEDFSLNNLHKMPLVEVVEVLTLFSYFQLGSSDLYLEIEKIIGKNIDQVDPNAYVVILDAFVKFNNYRDKFLTLVQNKMLEKKEIINVGNLCKLLRLFAALRISNQAIFEKMQDYLLSRKKEMNDYEICDFIFAYSGIQIQNNFVLNDMESIVEEKCVKWAVEKQYSIIIDILQSYVIANKGEKEFIEKLKNIVLNTYLEVHPKKIDELSVLKLYKIFHSLKVKEDQVELFEPFLRVKLRFYSKDEYEALLKFLKDLNYKNEETMQLLWDLLATNDDPNKKLSVLRKYNLIS